MRHARFSKPDSVQICCGLQRQCAALISWASLSDSFLESRNSKFQLTYSSVLYCKVKFRRGGHDYTLD